MANSNKLPNDDQSGIKPTNIDEIKLQEGIDKNALDDKSPQKDQTVESDESSGLYNPGGESSDESTKDSELNTSDQDNGDFKYNNQGSSEKRNIRSFFWGTKRRKQLTVGGVIFSVLLGGGLFGLTNLSGAAQLVQLSQMLQKNFRPMQKTSIVRGNRLLRFASSKDLGETRLGVLDKQVFRSALSDLSDIGITFGTNSAGQLNKSTIEADKLVKSYPELKDMSPEQKQAWLADKFNISSDLIAIHSGNRFTVDATDFPIKSLSALTKNTLGLLGDGRIISSINNRVFLKYFDLPSLFHPLQKAKAATLKGFTNVLDRRTAVRNDESTLTDEVNAEADSNVQNIKDNSSKYNSVVMKTIIFTSGACFIKSVAGDIVKVNRERVVLPSVIQSLNLISVGEQIKNGQDVSSDQVNAIDESLNDSKGGSIWQGKALQVTEGVSNPSGPDISPDYRQAYDKNTTAEKFTNYADDALGGHIIASGLCSPLGQIGQAIVVLVAGAASTFSEVASGGTLSPEIAAGWVAKQGLNFGVSAVAMHFLEGFILNSSASSRLAKDAFSGPVGGNLLAFGAREAGNIGARAQGGIALANSAVSSVGYQNNDQGQLAGKSLFARLFDMNDSNSVFGRLANSINPNIFHTLTNALHGFMNIGEGLFNNFSNIITPSISAAATYDWGFDQYGIPTDILNDASLVNPIDNANIVAQILDKDSSHTYKDKVANCFGLVLDKSTDNVWNLTPGNLVNPNDQDYIDAKCDNYKEDSNWKRIIIFVLDSRTMQSIACYSGDDQSCSDIGYDQNGSSSTTTAPGSGNAQQLAQQILTNKNIQLSGRDVQQDIQDAANNMPGTANVFTSAAILNLILAVGQSHSVTISAIQSGGTGHCNNTPKSSCPDDPHYNGDAVDFSALDNIPLTGRDTGSLAIIKIATGILPAGSGIGQSQCGATPPIPASWITFTDTCNHLHVQVPKGTL